MKFTLAPFFALGFAASPTLAQYMMINIPSSIAVCQSILFTWSGGTPPYSVSIFPGNQPEVAALVTFNSTNGLSLTWLVDLAAGTSLVLDIVDSAGSLAQSAPFTVQSGTNSNCVGNTSKTKSQHTILAITLGSVFGTLGFLVVLCVLWYFFRRRKRLTSQPSTIDGLNPAMSAIQPNAANNIEIWTRDQFDANQNYTAQSSDGLGQNLRYENTGTPSSMGYSNASGIQSNNLQQPLLAQLRFQPSHFRNDIGSKTAIHQPQMTGQNRNPYELGHGLFTNTENATPQMGDGRDPLENLPVNQPESTVPGLDNVSS